MNEEILQTLQELKAMVALLLAPARVKEYYEVEEFARLIGKAPYTVREYCRTARLCAAKKNSGRGKSLGWVIGHAELIRFQREGLLPKTTTN